MSVDTVQQQVVETEEEQRVRSWRFDQLARLGYAPADAAAIAADPAIDLEQARRLARLGCPAVLATKILL
jgi:hypothetical protein